MYGGHEELLVLYNILVQYLKCSVNVHIGDSFKMNDSLDGCKKSTFCWRMMSDQNHSCPDIYILFWLEIKWLMHNCYFKYWYKRGIPH